MTRRKASLPSGCPKGSGRCSKSFMGPSTMGRKLSRKRNKALKDLPLAGSGELSSESASFLVSSALPPMLPGKLESLWRTNEKGKTI